MRDETGGFPQLSDQLNRLIKKATKTGAVYYEYDKTGLKIKMTSPDAVSGSYFDFDAAGNMSTAKTFDPAGGVRVGTYVYDKSNMPTKEASPDNTVLKYFTYDVAGRTKQAEFKPGSAPTTFLSYFAYNRNANGLPTAITHEAGSNTYYTYDNLDRITAEARKSGATQLYGFTYEFDAAGNRTKKIDTNPATPVTTYYTYNSLNLMTKEFTQ